MVPAFTAVTGIPVLSCALIAGLAVSPVQANGPEHAPSARSVVVMFIVLRQPDQPTPSLLRSGLSTTGSILTGRSTPRIGPRHTLKVPVKFSDSHPKYDQLVTDQAKHRGELSVALVVGSKKYYLPVVSEDLPLGIKGHVIKRVYRLKLSSKLSAKLEHVHGRITVKHRIRQFADVNGDGIRDHSRQRWSSFRVVVPH